MFVFQICTGDRMSVSLGDPWISSIHRSFVVLHPYVYVSVLRYDHCHVPYQKYQKAHSKLRSACRQILILDKEASFLLWSMSQRPLAAGEDSILCFKLRAIVSPMSTSEMAYGPAWKPMAVFVAASARCIIWSSLFRRPDDLMTLSQLRSEPSSNLFRGIVPRCAVSVFQPDQTMMTMITLVQMPHCESGSVQTLNRHNDINRRIIYVFQFVQSRLSQIMSPKTNTGRGFV